MNYFEVLIPMVIIAVLSLIITFILFKFLQSNAVGEGTFFYNQKVKYGGALAGYIIIYSLLFYFYNKNMDKIYPNRAPECYSEINLDGEWKIDAYPNDSTHRAGKGNINQKKNSCILSVYGEFENLIPGKPIVHFNSKIAQISGTEFYIVYVNDDNEAGVCTGKIDVYNTNTFYMVYYDLYGFDRNNNPTGRLVWTKVTK